LNVSYSLAQMLELHRFMLNNTALFWLKGLSIIAYLFILEWAVQYRAVFVAIVKGDSLTEMSPIEQV
jgi:hypothetical protein